MPTVKQTISTDDEFAVEVESTVTGTKCHKCGQFIDKPFNKGREIKIRRSSAFGKPVYIRIAPPRCQCIDFQIINLGALSLVEVLLIRLPRSAFPN